MTREELCAALDSAPETAPGRLVAAWEGRRTELGAALELNGHAKPVKLRLREELRRLEDAEREGLVGQLRLAAQADRYLEDFAAEAAKPQPARAVLRLCLDKTRPIAAQITDESVRYGFERRAAELEEKIPPPPAPVVASPAPIEQGRPPSSHPPAESKNAAGSAIASNVPIGGPSVAAAETRGADAPPKNGADPRRSGENRDLSAPSPARVLDLIPVDGAETLRRKDPIIRFVTGDRFTLGRQSSADLVARFLPDTDENRRKTSTVSRVNTTLFLRGRQICVQDGELPADGAARPSTNGTTIDGQRVAGPLPLNFAKERRLVVGQFQFEIRALLLPGHSLFGPLASDDSGGAATQHATQCLPDRPLGCLRFAFTSPASGDILPVWLFTEAPIGSSADTIHPASAPLSTNSAIPPIALRIHHWRNGFWLEIPSGTKSVITLDGSPRSAGDVIPLRRAHALTIGNRSFHVQAQ